MSQFLGTYPARIDAKGRISVPPLFRNALRRPAENSPAQPLNAIVLRLSHHYPCIEAWPADVFAAFAAPMDRLDIFDTDTDALTTALYADAYPVEADKEGRIVLPDSMVGHAGLTDAVTFMGLGRLFQIWEPAAAAKRAVEAREQARAKNLTVPGRTIN